MMMITRQDDVHADMAAALNASYSNGAAASLRSCFDCSWRCLRVSGIIEVQSRVQADAEVSKQAPTWNSIHTWR